MVMGHCSQPPCSCSITLSVRDPMGQPLLLGLCVAAVMSQLAISGNSALAQEGFASTRGRDIDTFENIPGQLSSSGKCSNTSAVQLFIMFSVLWDL